MATKEKSQTIEMVQKTIKDERVRIVDLQFTDLLGTQHHISLPAEKIDEDIFENGKAFDGSSIKGWKGIQDSDMLLVPDPSTALLDPFYEQPTLNLRCDIFEPGTGLPYARDPRSVARLAEIYLQSTSIADKAFFGPEPEFCLFNDVRWRVDMQGSFYEVDALEAHWNSSRNVEGGNTGHRPGIKGGYFPLPPVDSAHDIRTAMCLTLEKIGQEVEAHHHEVASSQNEIAVRFNSLLKKADELQTFKYVIRNVAHQYGMSATFMPKPLVGDNGSGMHCHQSLQKGGKNLFSGDQYAGLSELALYYIGGIIHHARALNAFTNPSTNSYKRLVPGFEAPVLLAYSARNRSAAIRIPQSLQQHRRIEVRFPDPIANPYLAFAAMLMAGLDGIKNKIHPGDAIDKDLYDLPPEELKDIPSVSETLQQALDNLEKDHQFLLQGDVFNLSLIESYVALKRQEVERLNMTTHPIEFEMYYSS